MRNLNVLQVTSIFVVFHSLNITAKYTHVVEHLYNGDEVVISLLPKLKSNGFFYIEYPGKKSLKLPNTLNFYADPTHVRVYSLQELKEIFKHQQCKIIKAGIRKNIWNILAMPLRIIISFIKKQKLKANIFWDITGFAEYIYVKKL